MIKNRTIIEKKMGERVYELVLDPQSPLGEVFDVLCHMKSFVLEKMNKASPPAPGVPKEEPEVLEAMDV
jgi:hypothetical protein